MNSEPINDRPPAQGPGSALVDTHGGTETHVGSHFPNARACGAKTKKGPCTQPAMPNGRCYKHGGATPKGLAAGATKHGIWSDHLPPGILRDAYHQAKLYGPKLLQLVDDIALLDARAKELANRLKTGEHGSLWADVAFLCREAEIPGADLRGIIDQIARICQAGQANNATMRELDQAIHSKAKLVQIEVDIATKMRQFVTLQQLFEIMDQLAQTAKATIQDRTILDRFVKGLESCPLLVGIAKESRDNP